MTFMGQSFHITAQNEIIADVHGEDNAKLIAAAPELLEALQNLIELIPENHELSKGYAMAEAKAAVKKATT